MGNIVGNKYTSNNRLFYFVAGFIRFILFILFLLVYRPLDRYRKGRTLQALDPDKLPEDQRWSRERTIQELEKERRRRRMMKRDIYA